MTEAVDPNPGWDEIKAWREAQRAELIARLPRRIGGDRPAVRGVTAAGGCVGVDGHQMAPRIETRITSSSVVCPAATLPRPSSHKLLMPARFAASLISAAVACDWMSLRISIKFGLFFEAVIN